MLDKDKLWLVITCNIACLDDSDVVKYLNEVSDAFKYDDSVQTIILPTRTSETHVDFYNFENLNPKTLEEIESLIGDMKNKINNFKI
jgi:hypothetical protein